MIKNVASLISDAPVEARWMINATPLYFDFTVKRLGLRKLPDEVLKPDYTAAHRLLIFAEQNYAEGGGSRPWLCVDEDSGEVYGFDPERDAPLFFLNSSVTQFIATFRFLDKWLGANRSLPRDSDAQLRVIDPETYPNSDWRPLVECAMEPELPDAREGSTSSALKSESSPQSP